MSAEKVLLINPPLYRDPVWDPIRLAQPLGLWSLGTYLSKQGHNVKLLCAEMKGYENQSLHDKRGDKLLCSPSDQHSKKCIDFAQLSVSEFHTNYLQDSHSYLRIGMEYDDILRQVNDFSPNVIGISSCFTCNHQSVVDLAKFLRLRLGKNCLIVAGGQHATAWPEALFRDTEGAIDFIVQGEGERAFADIVRHCHNKDAVRTVSQVCYWEDGHLLSQHQSQSSYYDGVGLLDLDLFYDLDPCLMEGQGYDRPLHTYPTHGRKFTDILFSVGCHRHCAFCFANDMRGHLRWLGEQRVLQMLNKLRSAGYEELVLQDDDLLRDRIRFVGLAQMIKALGFKWQNNGGLEFESLDRDRVETIIESGCTSVYIPFNPRRLKDRVPNKPERRKLDLVKRIHDSGIYTFTSGMYGVPDLACPRHFLDDMDRLADSHTALVEQQVFDAALAFPLAVLPGTRWWKELSRPCTEQIFTFDRNNWLDYSIFVPQVYPKRLVRAEFELKMLEIHKRLNNVQKSYSWFSPFPNAAYTDN